MFLGNHYLSRKKRPKADKKSGHHRKPALSHSNERLMLALEPRFLFDAAGLIAGVELVPQHDTPDISFDPSLDSVSDGFVDHHGDTAHSGLMSFIEAMASPVPPAVTTPATIVFVDAGVMDPDALVGDVAPGTLVFTLDADTDGVFQISDILSQYDNVAAVHIISHGESGSITLGDAELSGGTIENYTETLTGWGAALSPGADILIYGCDVARGMTGKAFVAQLADITGADVAASDDPTGAADQGGDWELETRIGLVESDIGISQNACNDFSGLLANYTVDISTDELDGNYAPGDLSLREALYLAENNTQADNIYFDLGLSGSTIALNYGELGISSVYGVVIDGDINGDDAFDITIDAGSGSRVFNVGAGASATLNGLKITGGYSSSHGGGIYNAGDLTISNSIVYGNESGNCGGGIHNYYGSLDISYSTISDNYAYRHGGGIHSVGDQTIYQSTISDNYAYRHGGGILHLSGTADITDSTISGNEAVSGDGGGIWNFATVTLDNSTVHNNIAYGNGGGVYQYFGTLNAYGGSFISGNYADYAGGGIYNSWGTVNVTGSYLYGNDAVYVGGGIFNTAGGTVNVTNSSVILGNYAGVDGGGIFNTGGTVTVDSSDLVYNTAYLNAGGGIWNSGPLNVINGSGLYKNSAGMYGGGIYSFAGTVTLSQTQVYGNDADYGGGVWNRGTLNAQNLVFISKNYASYAGGGIYNTGGTVNLNLYAFLFNNDSEYGGGIYNTGAGTVNLTKSAVAANYADYGGGIWNDAVLNVDYGSYIVGNYADYKGGGIYNTGTVYVTTGSAVYGNYAQQGGGIWHDYGDLKIQSGSYVGYNRAYAGGGVFAGNAAVTITDSTISNNIAGYTAYYYGYGGYAYGYGYGAGGGIYNTGSTIYISGSTISDNTAGVYVYGYNGGYACGYGYGGGIFNATGTINITGSTISGNTAGANIYSYYGYAYGKGYGAGGGIYNAIGAVNVTDSTISNNNAGVAAYSYNGNVYAYGFGAGGGIGNYVGTVNITDSTISNNTAGYLYIDTGYGYGYGALGYGGGVFNIYGKIGISGSTISGNAAARGGGLDTVYGMVDIDNSTISKNIAGYYVYGYDSGGFGGGVYNYAGTVTIRGKSTISGNVAYAYGGGIASYSNTVTVTDSTISNNSAYYGGGIANNYGTVVVDNSRVSDNYASADGGGIWNYSYLYVQNGSTISGNDAGGLGGGIFNMSSYYYGRAAIYDSTISDNSAYWGGGIENYGFLYVSGSTIMHNDADYGGGGIDNWMGYATIINSTLSYNNAGYYSGGGIYNYAPSALYVYHSTFNGNTAPAPYYGAGIYNAGGDVYIGHTIMADDLAGGIYSNGYNLFTQGTVTGASKIDILGGNPDLQPLADNGGPTLTHGLGPYSDALSAGDPTAVAGKGFPLYDQRGPGFTRVKGVLDIGAVEGNLPPTAYDDAFGTNEDTAFTTGNVLVNDSDSDGDPLSVSAVDTTGTLGLVTDNGDGTFDYDPNGQFDYLAVGEKATDTFAYTVSDGNGGTDTATVTVTVTGVNDPPTAVDDGGTGFTTSKDTPLTTGNVLINDTDPDTSDVLSVTAIDTKATLGLVTDNGNGTFSYDPNGQFGFLNPGDTATDTFTYTVSDGSGGTDTATVTITVTGVNLPPVAIDDGGYVFTTAEDTPFTTPSVLDNDVDPEAGPLSVAALDTTATKGLVSQNADGTFDYDPNGRFDYLNIGQTATDTFSYTVMDDQGNMDTAQVTITITGVGSGTMPPAGNDPIANDDAYTTDEDTALTIGNVLSNDTDLDGDPLSVTAVDTTMTKGKVTDNGDGTFDYDPRGPFDYLAVGEKATDSFSYTVSDGNGGTDTATVTITVTGVNDTPTANDDGYTTVENKSVVTGNVLFNDSDPDASDNLSVSGLDSAGTKGVVTDNGNGTFTYDPDGRFSNLQAGETEVDSFTYTVSDGNGGTDTARVSVTITGATDPITWQRDYLPIEKDGMGHPRAGYPGGLFTSGGRAMAGLFGQGHPNAWTLEGGNGFAAAPDVSENIPPTASPDSFTTNGNTAMITGNVLANDDDPNPSDVLSVTGLDTSGTRGLVKDNGDGTFAYDPNGRFDDLTPGETARDTFSYTVSDGHGGTDSATVTITVVGPNDSADNDQAGEQGKMMAAPDFNAQVKTAAGRFEHERTAFLGQLAGDGSQAA